MQNHRYIWLLPFSSLLIGVLILLFGWWERETAMSDIKSLFDGHVRSIASLIEESTHEAATATSLIYELTEEHLQTAAHLLSMAHDVKSSNDKLTTPDDSWKIYLLLNDDGAISGEWGPMPENERSEFLDLMKNNPDTLFDGDPAERHRLICYSHRIQNKTAIVCRDSGSLESLHSEVGLPILLKRVIRDDILYVAIQDAEGILAATPSGDTLSSWRDDALLEIVLHQSDPRMVTRFITAKPPVFEGLMPFTLPDGSQSLLRIGIDASTLAHLEADSLRRYYLMAALVTGLFFLSCILALMFNIWRRRQKEAEELLAKREEERKHWETIGQMAATVAHEVRNPLNTLGMIAQRLQREFVVAQEQQQEFEQMINLLQSESGRVNRVVTEFLELGRPLVISSLKTNIAELLEEAVLPARLRAEREGKRLRLENSCIGDMFIDNKLFMHICGNLLGNALDALQPKGEVHIEARCAAGEFVLSVSDDGPGIAAEQLEEIMKPFISFKSNGTGLGLPLVKRYAEALNGTFELSSVYGSGTKAVVTIPTGLDMNGDR